VVAAAKTAGERVASTRPPLVFSLLGDFAARRGSWPVEREAWGRPMAARLMRFMLINRDRAVPEELVLEALWPGKPRESARRSLQVAASSVRAVLDLSTDCESALAHSGDSYRLSLREEDIVDVDEFESAAAAAVAERGALRRRLLEQADSLWAGEPLPEDRYEAWTLTWRERLVDRYVEVLSALAKACREAGDHHAAIGAARRCVETDPLNEAAHRELMGGYARAGRTGFALRQYLACRRALVDGLGVEPSEPTSRLHGRILAGEVV
jgi:DNA-binding SARP family transcriptional activator